MLEELLGGGGIIGTSYAVRRTHRRRERGGIRGGLFCLVEGGSCY